MMLPILSCDGLAYAYVLGFGGANADIYLCQYILVRI